MATLLAGLDCVSAGSGPALVRFDLQLQAPRTLPLEGVLILRPVEGAGEPLRVVLGQSAAVAPQVAPGSKWEVTAEIPGYWAPRPTFTAGAPGTVTVQAIELWPLGTISGHAKSADRDVPLPKTITVTTMAAPQPLKRPAAPKGLLECPIGPDGGWSCTLPAAVFDLSVGAPGFIPKYLSSVAIPPGKTLSLGTFELRRGASVAGWVAVEGGAIDPATCKVRLAPMTSPGAGMREAATLPERAVEQAVGRDGLFQVTGLAPGFYQLEVRQPGYAAAQVSALRVARGAETFLREPLVLARPVRLELSIAPALDWLGRPWRVQVSRWSQANAGFGSPVFDGAAGEEGRAAVPEQAPGRFWVRLLDSLGNTLYSDREVEVESAADAGLAIEVDLVTVEGEITLGGEPLAARLWFGLRHGSPSVQMESGAAGRFHGVLPRDGRWPVEISAGEPKLATLTNVEARADEAGLARVEIPLPDTRVFGRVVDPEGKPVPEAYVEYASELTGFWTTADAQGGFELRALPAGAVTLIASAAKRASSPMPVSLAEDQTIGPVELRLRASKPLRGTVRTAFGPAAGAVVDASARSRGLADAGDRAIAGLDGGFEVQIPESATGATLVVSAPGQALTAFEVQAGVRPAVLQVAEAGGTLVIAPAKDEEEDAGALAVWQNGLQMPVPVLLKWAMGHGQSPPGTHVAVLRIPHLAPGEYRVCRTSRMAALGLAAGPAGRPEPRCAAGSLASGATLHLAPGAP